MRLVLVTAALSVATIASADDVTVHVTGELADSVIVQAERTDGVVDWGARCDIPCVVKLPRRAHYRIDTALAHASDSFELPPAKDVSVVVRKMRSPTGTGTPLIFLGSLVVAAGTVTWVIGGLEEFARSLCFFAPCISNGTQADVTTAMGIAGVVIGGILIVGGIIQHNIGANALTVEVVDPSPTPPPPEPTESDTQRQFAPSTTLFPVVRLPF